MQKQRTRILLLYLSFACITIAHKVNAQHCDPSTDCHCSSASGTPAGIMVGHSHEKGTWMGSYRYMFMNMKGNQSGTQSVSDQTVFSEYLMSPSHMQMQMHMVMGMYGITDRLSVMAMVNYQSASMSMDMFSASSHQHVGANHAMASGNMDMITSGLADSKVYVSYGLLQKANYSLVLSGGVNLPTGRITHTGDAGSMYPGIRLPYMMQTGSGTFDLMPGLTYIRVWDKWQWGIQATAVYRPFYNTLGYRLGNEFTNTTWISRKVGQSLFCSARLEGGVQGKIEGRDVSLYSNMEPTANHYNYGGTLIKMYPGLTYSINKGWLNHNTFAVEGGWPLYQQLNGVQLSGKATLYGSWIISF